MSQLNSLRVGLKHRGTLPHVQTVRDLTPRVEAFCEEVTKSLLDLDFADLSLADLIDNEEVRNTLREAQEALNNDDKDQAFTKVRIAFDKIHGEISKDIPLITELRRTHLSRAELSDDLERYLYNLHDAVAECIETLNVSMLGIDPVRYTFFLSCTPHISWALAGNYQVNITQDYNRMPEDAFQTCFEFVVDVALNAYR